MDNLPRVGDFKRRGPLLGNFEENILNNRLELIRTVDGYRAELRATGLSFQARPFNDRVKVSFLSAGDSFPYLCQVHFDKCGHRIPKKGTLQVALFNPLGTIVKLFYLLYDLTDMPSNSQTFLRQRTVFLPSKRIRYLIQFNIVSSKSGKIYLNKDLRILISKKVDLETASQIDDTTNQTDILKSIDEMPANPKYFAR